MLVTTETNCAKTFAGWGQESWAPLSLKSLPLPGLASGAPGCQGVNDTLLVVTQHIGRIWARRT